MGRFTLLAFLALAGSVTLSAQQQSPSAATGEAEEERVVVLSPFTVESDRDFGYRKTNAMTATRIGASILETPLNISVVSKELLEDLAVENTVAMFNYTPSVSTNYDSATTLLPPGADGGVKIRGFGTSFVYQDNIRRYTSFHLDGVDRTEVVRGPVGLYFGRSDPGGVINFVSKKPQFENRTDVKLTYGSDDFKKALVDHQMELIDEQLAYRVTLSKRDSDDWFDSVSWDEEYILGNIAWRPTKNIDLLFQYENFDQSKTGGTVAAIVAQNQYLEAAAAGQLILKENGLYENSGDYGRRIFAETGVDIRSFDGYWFPQGHTFNRNGPGAFDNNKHETFQLTGLFKFAEGLNLRITAGQTETDGEISWFINQDPHQAPSIFAAFANNDGNPNVFTALNYGFFISPSFAPDGSTFSPGRQADVHEYDFGQADLTYDFELFGASHTLVASLEIIEDEFTQYGFLTNRDAFIKAGGIPGGVQGFGTDAGISAESNAILAAKRQQLVDWGLLAAESPFQGNVPWSQFFVDLSKPNPPIPNMQDFIGGRTVQSRAGSDSSDKSYSLTYRGKFIEDRLIGLAGVRRIDYDVINASVNSSGVRSTSGEELNFSQTVFTAGLNFSFTEEIVGYVSYSENFVPSTSRNDVWVNVDTGATEGGDRVEPQTGEGFEVGVKTSLYDGVITSTVSLFDLKRANIDIQDLARGQRLSDENAADGDIVNGPWFNQRTNEPAGALGTPPVFRFAGGEQQVQGGEIEVIYTPNRNFQGIFSASYFWKAEWTSKDPTLINVNRGGLYTGNFGNDGRDAIPDRMENVPSFEFGLWGVYSFDEGALRGFRVGLGGNYADHQIHEVRTNFNPYVTDSWFRIDAMVSYGFDAFRLPMKAQLNVSNLLDEEYITGSFGIAPTREWKLSLSTSF